MPNVVYMGGFQCKPAKPLPEHLEEFAQSSGEHGLIIMSLGTFIAELPPDLADEIAAAFAKLPQKVIWRYKGAKPATLGNNTLLVDWMPQNDLLGHPKTKLFVAHGGTNGVQEAIYHGVPVIGLPLIFDQPDNVRRLEVRGAGKVLDFFTLTEEIFSQGIQEVLHDPSYRTNMQRLSRLHRDQPMKPMDTALFWIEFVMRHKGAAHLRTESYKLPWYSYHSVDVVLFLTATVLLIILTIVTVFKYLFTKVCKTADLWLMRVDFVFEFPRPTMPNVVYMGGFQCKPAKPLPEHLEEFAQSSGEHGLIIMSLGTFIAELPPDLADEIAAAFAKLPQKVIWRYQGAKPATLGNNTLLVDWMPQNDLLGHPKTKLFVSHGGTNGIQEAIYHGVPVIGLPLIFDQPDNVRRLEDQHAETLQTAQRPAHEADGHCRLLDRVCHETQRSSSPEDRVLQTALVLLPLCGRDALLSWHHAGHFHDFCCSNTMLMPQMCENKK
ncbi:unnamed protein product [Tetraodon nigroviridis]|uniref:UDP-glucuronosyltransferase n=1 Tax=Tetraodon nigroviridis TaxID=99883 RepID=Q4S869_TETNG|nr:unnamed protein product [Tetraodon nigroviridis]